MSLLDQIVQRELTYKGDDGAVKCLHDWELTTTEDDTHSQGWFRCRLCRRTEIVVVRKGTYVQG